MRIEVHRWLKRGAVVGGAAGLALAAIPAVPAMAGPNPPCGSTITVNTTLSGNMVCAGDALRIGADGITLNLAGHTIKGGATGTGVIVGPGSGNHATIRNGTIQGFAASVTVTSLDGVTMTGLKVVHGGISVRFSTNARFVKGTLTNTRVQTTHVNLLVDHVTANNSVFQLGEDSNRTQITNSKLKESPVNVEQSDHVLVGSSTLDGSPVDISQNSASAAFRSNMIRNTDTGIGVFGQATSDQFVANSFFNDRIGLRIDVGQTLGWLDGVRLSGNQFMDNKVAGALIEATGTVGLPASAAVQRNGFFDNGHASGGFTDHLGIPVADGLHIAIPAGANVVVATNKGISNFDRAIFAIPGTVVDGGGNTSFADPGGCVGVTCT